MTERQKQGRIAGAWYMAMGFTAPIGLMVVPDKLIVSGDAVATADRIRASESLLRRFRKEGELPRIHPRIDLCNAASLTFAVRSRRSTARASTTTSRCAARRARRSTSRSRARSSTPSRRR